MQPSRINLDITSYFTQPVTMDHSHHMQAQHDMSGTATAHRCQMSMLFTWNTQDLCLVRSSVYSTFRINNRATQVFRWWHISNTLTLILSLLCVVALSAGYEFVRELSRRYEARVDNSSVSLSPPSTSFYALLHLIPQKPILRANTIISLTFQDDESGSLLSGRNATTTTSKRGRSGKAAFYGIQVFYSFFIM